MVREKRVRNQDPQAPAADSHALREPEAELVDYQSLTIADLKGLMADRGLSLPSKAHKQEYVDALEAS